MFAITCEECDRTYLVSTSSIQALYSTEPGVIVAEVACLRGHLVRVVTGNATPSSTPVAAGPTVPQPRHAADATGPSVTATEPPGILARASAWVSAKLAVQAWMFSRFDYRVAP
ncbi:hypothetical protein [Tenggerimyces flavus]|uniref:Uncharacterized protein n=1 Tax=Tenggerimyces flavus TaxID=1708749 RepID=A0ABV7YET9_9ACTN|nr:hypothetical protein [Tenggerimyces flavus]MBM7785973.1 hypothetical protein [Tenggerimyces flavus]